VHDVFPLSPSKGERAGERGPNYSFGSPLPAAWTALLIVVALAATPAFAQKILLTGATVHTVTGDTLSPGQVLIQDGKIAAVGATVPGDGASKVDLAGQHLYPGIIALDTAVGLMEIEAVRATIDSAETGDFKPEVQSWIAVNPDSELIPVTRANGIAYFEPVPAGGSVSGQSGMVAVEGWTTEQRAAKAPLALHVVWPAMDLELSQGRQRGPMPDRGRQKSLPEQAKERRARLQSMGDFFDEAKAYAKAKDAAASGKAKPLAPVPAWEAMLPYVQGSLPIVIHANEVRQIKSAVNWAATNHYKIIIAGGRDAAMVAPLLAEKSVPVIYEDVYSQPVRETDTYDYPFKTPELLHQAGVKVAFSLGADNFNAPLTRSLPFAVAQAVAFGLPEAEGEKGLTIYPAQMAGMADRLGSIETGKEATLVALDGKLLDIRANVKHLWLAGKDVSLESRHTKLYQKYLNRPRPEGAVP
jgi:imidazolonepropionase-like amidohydrolase